jgi:hypothetical protein
MITVLLLTLGITACAFAQQAAPSYRTITEIYDWGAAIPKIIVDLGKTVLQNMKYRSWL